MNGFITWFIKNPVAANLLMIIIVIAGLVAANNIDNEFFPDVQPSIIRVDVPYPGAGPLEVEEQICMKIEEAISDVPGIKEVVSTASQGMGSVQVETVDGWDLQQMLNDVKTRVDAISTFPVDAERPIVTDLTMGSHVVSLVVYGGQNEQAIKDLALQLKDEIYHLPGVSEVRIDGIRDSQVAVEIPETTLRAYGLSLEDVAKSIRGSSLNLPAGQMRNEAGDIQLQVYGQDYQAREFQDIVVLEKRDGSQITLGQIADLADSFEDKNFLVEFNGKIAAQLNVLVGENPDTIGTSARVKAFMEARQGTLPPGFKMELRRDRSVYLRDRLEILTSNSLQGLVLVFILLLLFLRPRLALWVSVGIAVAYLGALTVMYMVGVSLNVTSTFAFLLILGIVVDDAIVVSENIYSQHEQNMRGPLAAMKGVTQIAKPVVLAVLTTLIVFLPMLFMTGTTAQIFAPIPIVAIAALTFSLVEALLVLPSHLSHLPPEKAPTNRFEALLLKGRHWFNRLLNRFSFSFYQPLLDRSLKHCGATLAIFLAILMICLSTFMGGWVPVRFTPSIPMENITIKAKFQEGIGYAHVLEVKEQIERGVAEIKTQSDVVDHDGRSAIISEFMTVDGNVVTLEVGLVANGKRNIANHVIEARLKEVIGTVAGAESFDISSSVFGLTKDISFRLAGTELTQLDGAATYLKQLLGSYDGVTSISDSLSSARQEIRISLKPHAEVLGVTLEDVARQVRHAFYGAEAQRIPQLREDVKVMVRYPADQRGSVEYLEEMRIRLGNGVSVPFSEVAEANFQPGYTTITRTNRDRVITVSANAIRGVVSPSEIVETILRDHRQEFSEKFPGVTLGLEGEQEEQGEFVASALLGGGFALLFIYTLLAVEFKSYLQPFYILIAVPFGVAGAIIGHLIMGMDFAMPSVMGILATAGVVVNANLVLIDQINNRRDGGAHIVDAVKQAARDRLRPILLTSITTFFGLMPIMMEPSPAAAVLKPVVVSLSFGVLFATTITLLMVPAMYLSLESFKLRLGFRERADVNFNEA